ncbi:hypothetical protein Tco_0991183 [Tanacetum coccineum]|uniref:Uncharacterized protein n=1 Tax=Tanacetum coccineum TaxID=301880 RepID=A0ABQ5EYX4_9ASTR
MMMNAGMLPLDGCFPLSEASRFSGGESLVGCGCGGDGNFHGKSSCEDDSVDDSRLIEVKWVFTKPDLVG